MARVSRCAPPASPDTVTLAVTAGEIGLLESVHLSTISPHLHGPQVPGLGSRAGRGLAVSQSGPVRPQPLFPVRPPVPRVSLWEAAQPWGPH